jgi:anti-sigma B factor antagonist
MTLEGDLDLSTAAQLYERLDELARAGFNHVALDLSDLQFLDSTGLSVLLTEHKRAESVGGELVILSPTRKVRRVLQITGLDSYLNIRPKVPLPPSP